MKILLDSHLLVWISEDSAKLPRALRSMLDDETHRFFFSAVSSWELAIKSGLGKLNYRVNVQQLYAELLDHGYEQLSLLAPHTFALKSLPSIHKDPFDRILIAQAIAEDMVLMTSDETMTGRSGWFGRWNCASSRTARHPLRNG